MAVAVPWGMIFSDVVLSLALRRRALIVVLILLASGLIMLEACRYWLRKDLDGRVIFDFRFLIFDERGSAYICHGAGAGLCDGQFKVVAGRGGGRQADISDATIRSISQSANGQGGTAS